MATVAKDNGGADYKPAPEGTHIARCVRVIDLGTQAGSQQYPDPKHKIMLTWELCEERSEYEGEMRPMLVSKRYTLSLHKKAGLRHDLESWRGRPFTAEELQGFDLAKVLGHACMITIVHAPSQDGTKVYANIKAVTSVPRSMAAATPAPVHELLHYQIEEGAGGCFGKLHEKLRDTIRQAEEWRGAPEEDAPPPAGDDDKFSDDIPF